MGTGRYKHIREACKQAIRVTRTIEPRAKAKKRYAEFYGQYRRLYPALKDEFVRIAEM